MFETAIIVALIAVSGSFAAALIPLLREYLQDKKQDRTSAREFSPPRSCFARGSGRSAGTRPRT